MISLISYLKHSKRALAQMLTVALLSEVREKRLIQDIKDWIFVEEGKSSSGNYLESLANLRTTDRKKVVVLGFRTCAVRGCEYVKCFPRWATNRWDDRSSFVRTKMIEIFIV